VWAWGLASDSVSYVYRPATLEDLRAIFPWPGNRG